MSEAILKSILSKMEKMEMYMDWDEKKHTGIIYLEDDEKIRYNEIAYEKIEDLIELLKYLMDGCEEDARKGLTIVHEFPLLKTHFSEEELAEYEEYVRTYYHKS